MRKTMLATGIAVATMGMAAFSANADEGMWVPQQLPEIAGPLKQAGLKLDPKQLADLTGDPMGAVVSLGGCTASFVSPQGLVVTNHHCAAGAIQLNSTAENNLLEKGFNAATTADEVSAGPNARIFVLDEITDVTDQVKAAIAAAPGPLERTKAVDDLEKQLVAACEADAGHRCHLYSFMGGNTYRLFKNIEIKDVRLAYAPPGSVGNYGGEIDNWMWPRHTGDFSFYRAYVGKDGKPAAFSKDNVPFVPKRWLQIADQPLREGDFVMVAGYPGSTARYALAADFDATSTWTYPTISRRFKELVAMVEAAGAKNPDIAVRYAASVQGWGNTLKNYDGQMEGFKRMGASAIKREREQAVLDWLKSRGADGAQALAAHETLVKLGDDARKTRERDSVIGNVGGALGGSALTLYRLSVEREKPDAQRESGFQQRDLPGIEGGIKQMERRYVAEMDRQIQRYWLMQYIALPADQRIAAIDAWIGGNDAKAVDAALDRLNTSKLGSLDERMKWLSADRKAFEASTDPAIQYAVAMLPTSLKLEEDRKLRAGETIIPRATYLQAVADYNKEQGKAVYPDANSSLRITFGNVMGYTKPGSSKAEESFTTLEQVAAKATGKDPFDAPQVQLDAIKAKKYSGMADAKLKTVPVNFLSDLDITGGNSGSPVLDAHGKLVGLAFDGNWESVASNWVFDPTVTRMISVDQRYMRWIMQEVMPAPQLLKEMGVAPKM
ncbi:dipeptidyl peptidase S46 family protein [Thermomonas carbonis]|uniref:S46 family peptidase n=1 Tax=Thermomonas carbonis TaxID=1463158 RepID=UPI0016765849|nr:S46 family peptidase [Thermomonas carbonis]GHC07798.1 dipeptidyl peptidase S46 family protein [Thermomonas carbonis]